jgi:hypothetical protein
MKIGIRDKETTIVDMLSAEALDAPVTGVGLSPGTLRDQLDEDVTLLVFLRQFGCMFCREMVSELRIAAEESEVFPSVLFLSQGNATEGRAFLRRYWPGARAIADPRLELYDVMGIRRGGLMDALGPRVFAARSRARDKGFENGPISGDIWRMPGLIAVRQEKIVWSHRAAHAADHPDFSRIPDLIRLAAE